MDSKCTKKVDTRDKVLDHIMDVIALRRDEQEAVSSQELQSALMLMVEFSKILYYVYFYQFCHLKNKYRYWKQYRNNRAASIASDYGLDDRRIGAFTSLYHPDSGTHPTSYPMGTGGSFPGLKQPVRELTTELN
jgi:hypothetical protein